MPTSITRLPTRPCINQFLIRMQLDHCMRLANFLLTMHTCMLIRHERRHKQLYYYVWCAHACSTVNAQGNHGYISNYSVIATYIAITIVIEYRYRYRVICMAYSYTVSQRSSHIQIDIAIRIYYIMQLQIDSSDRSQLEGLNQSIRINLCKAHACSYTQLQSLENS